MYKRQDNTHSASLPDDVPQDVKEQRAEELMELQQGISWALNQQRIGQTHRVLFDRTEGGYLIGRTQYDSPEVDNEVLVPLPAAVQPGQFAHVHITNAEAFDLFGDLV